MTNLVTDEIIELFAQVTGDRNPLHFDDAYAATTPYKGRVVHGAMLVGFFSGVLANQLPGPGAIGRGLSVRFKHPVRPGALVVSKVVVRELVPKLHKAVFDCLTYVGDELVAKGDAITLLPE